MAHDAADDVCETWEDMIENGVLDRKLEELQVKTAKNSEFEYSKFDVSLPTQVKLEDSSRTQYVPQVKILKRPSDAKLGLIASGEKSPTRQPVKTLQQREAEYAEARLRILGSASSEEEAQKEKTHIAVASSEETVICNTSTVIRQPRGPDGTKGFLQQR